MNIRSGTTPDYAAIAQISQLAMPHNSFTLDQLHNHEQTLGSGCKLGYFVAEADGQLTGFSRYIQWSDMHHPQVFWVTVQVHPAHQQRGIGTQLYQALSEALAPDQPIAFKSAIYEGDQGALIFSQKYEFQEYSRRLDLVCDLQAFDPTPYQSRIDRLREQGVHIVPISAIADDERGAWMIYDLQWSLELDVPIDETLTQPGIKQWRKEVLDNPNFMREASFVAMEGDDYMGLTEVFKYSDDHLYIEFTGTRPQFRKRGIATAMKILGMQWSKQAGYKTIGTTNDAVNTPMITINQKMGFVAQPARIQIQKTF